MAQCTVNKKVCLPKQTLDMNQENLSKGFFFQRDKEDIWEQQRFLGNKIRK